MGGVITAHSILGYGTILDIITNKNLINDLINIDGIGETQIQSCDATSNRQCEICPFGTTDNDSDPLTACVP